VKIDASKDFEALSAKIDSIKMAATLIGDEEVLVDLVRVFAQHLDGMFLFSLKSRPEVHKVLTLQMYEKEISKYGFARIAQKEVGKDEAKKVSSPESAKAS